MNRNVNRILEINKKEKLLHRERAKNYSHNVPSYIIATDRSNPTSKIIMPEILIQRKIYHPAKIVSRISPKMKSHQEHSLKPIYDNRGSYNFISTTSNDD